MTSKGSDNLLEVDLRNYILEQKEISGIIGNRLYPGWIPKNATLPSVAYLNVSRPAHHDIDVTYPRVQFSIFSKRYDEAKEIASEFKSLLSRFKGEMGNTNIIQIAYQNEYDMYEQDTSTYHIAIDFKIIYWE